MTHRTGRHLTSRIRARGWLRVESPLHVGGLDGDPSAPLTIAVDGQGRPYVPGTGLAGVLRAWTRGAGAENDGLRDLWGFIPDTEGPAPKKGGEAGQAARLIVADGLITTEPRESVLTDPMAIGLELRPSVGISRVTGTAAPEILHHRWVVPVGHYVRLELEIESDSAEPTLDGARMAALLTALEHGEIRLGAAASRGYGAVRLLSDPLDLLVDRFDSPEGLLAVLRDAPSRRRTLADLRGDPDLPPRRETLEVHITWRPLAPVMVRAARDGLVVDTLPLTTRVSDGHLTLTLPGSSIKGALRSHAEFVTHTALGPAPAAAADDTESLSAAADYSTAFRQRLDRLAVVRALFGAARDDTKNDTGDAARHAGALRAEECTANVTIRKDLWDQVTDPSPPSAGRRPSAVDDSSPPSLPEQLLEDLDELGLAQADHVGLDRWTGGAADGRLFSVLEPYGVDWNPIRLSVDLTRLSGSAGEDAQPNGGDEKAALALLLLTLRDLAAGRVPLGALVNRGFGDIEVSGITLTGGPWPTPTTLRDALNGPASGDLTRAWQTYLDQEKAS
jgi:CRISPR/Cas system CSM-associated protein Csm3 (group 7 of RAMP superfamily)